jgi:hypothetical protein
MIRKGIEKGLAINPNLAINQNLVIQRKKEERKFLYLYSSSKENGKKIKAGNRNLF